MKVMLVITLLKETTFAYVLFKLGDRYLKMVIDWISKSHLTFKKRVSCLMLLYLLFYSLLVLENSFLSSFSSGKHRANMSLFLTGVREMLFTFTDPKFKWLKMIKINHNMQKTVTVLPKLSKKSYVLNYVHGFFYDFFFTINNYATKLVLLKYNNVNAVICVIKLRQLKITD